MDDIISKDICSLAIHVSKRQIFILMHLCISKPFQLISNNYKLEFQNIAPAPTVCDGNQEFTWDCCSKLVLCKENEGDCDSNNDCEGDLICSFEMCPNTNGNGVDCCGQGPTSVTVTAADLIEVFDNDS